MRVLGIVAGAVLALALLAPAAAAQPDAATLRLTSPDGSSFLARVASDAPLTAACSQRRPAGVDVGRPTRAVLISDGRPIGTFRIHVVDGGLALESPPGASGRWCEPTEQLVRAVAAARPMPGPRAVWLAFAVAFAGLGVVIALVALAGAGVGPPATLSGSGEDDSEADEAPGHADADASA